MPFYVRVNRCPKGHELTVYADPQAGDVIELRWSCEPCEAERQADARGDNHHTPSAEAVGGAGDIALDLVCPEGLSEGQFRDSLAKARQHASDINSLCNYVESVATDRDQTMNE